MLQRFYDYLLKNASYFALMHYLFAWFVVEIREYRINLPFIHIWVSNSPLQHFSDKRKVPNILAVLIPLFCYIVDLGNSYCSSHSICFGTTKGASYWLSKIS